MLLVYVHRHISIYEVHMMLTLGLQHMIFVDPHINLYKDLKVKWWSIHPGALVGITTVLNLPNIWTPPPLL